MTINELIKSLTDLASKSLLGMDTTVLMSSDPEGNSHSEAADACQGWYVQDPNAPWVWENFGDEYEDDFEDEESQPQQVVVLYPTN